MELDEKLSFEARRVLPAAARAGVTAARAESVDLVNEDDGGLVLAS